MVWVCYGMDTLGCLTTAPGTETTSGDGMCRGLRLFLALPKRCWAASLAEQLTDSVVVCLGEHSGTGVVYLKSHFSPHPRFFKVQRGKE